jgi:hypothetical protein
MKKLKWTKTENDILINNYQLTKKEILSLLPNRSSSAINIQASKLKLKKNRNEYCNSKLDVLLDDTHEIYYWIGFILADGSITKNRLKILLAKKDKSHLEKLSLLLQTTLKISKRGDYYLHCQDRFIIPQIKQKFDIKENKTYFPPSISHLPSDNKLLSLFIGYIDGDGSITKQYKRQDCIIRLQVHSSWLNWLLFIYNFLNLTCAKPFINSRGYTQWNICDKKLQSLLKTHIIKEQLPVLDRKWHSVS